MHPARQIVERIQKDLLDAQAALDANPDAALPIMRFLARRQLVRWFQLDQILAVPDDA